jgi:3-hydroxyacyl-[acyl-carrier-protein] dehydratase
MATVVMNIEKIREYLPHRYPFLLIDRITELNPGKSIFGIKNVTINEPIFQGHFPHQAIFPGVLMLEMLAQAAGLLIYMSQDDPKKASKELYVFAGADNVRFKRIVVPGDQLTFEITIETQKKNYEVVKFNVEASVDNELACKASLLLVKKINNKKL